jgi:hypothetical protein
MSWLWMNVPAMVVFFAAWTGIPLYMVITRPDWGGGKRTSVKQREMVKVRGDARPTAVVAGGTR